MTWESAMITAFVKAIAVTLATACIRRLFGEQASNCVLLVILWIMLYGAYARNGTRPRPGKRLRGRRRPRRRNE